MSDFGDGIIDRLGNNTGLRDKDNPFHLLINNGVGGWLDKFDEQSIQEQVFLETSSGSWLDVHGRQYNVSRRLGEDDDAYRERIVYESLGHVNVPLLESVYGLVLYCFVDDFSVEDNTLTSDNVFACHKYMSFVDTDLRSVLDKKYVLDTGLTYIEG